MPEAAPVQTLGQVRSVGTRRGTQREYETVMILRPNVNKTTILELVRKIDGVFKSQGARLLKIENWGLRTLAYPVKKCKNGIYMYWQFIGGSDLIREFERNLSITDSVIRFYTIRIDDDVDPNARPSEITEDLLDSVSEPPPEPEPEPEPEPKPKATETAATEAKAKATEAEAPAAAEATNKEEAN
ncbi:MAG: 30S ribosomal protein S6 [Nannocystaceae bacterium]